MVKNVRVPNVEYLENNKPETFEKCFNASQQKPMKLAEIVARQ